MKRISDKRVKGNADYLLNKEGLKDFPQLFHFLSDAQYTDGKDVSERMPGTWWLSCRNGAIQCVLKEPSQGLILRVEVPSLAALLNTVEAALGSEGSMWEKDQFEPKMKKKR